MMSFNAYCATIAICITVFTVTAMVCLTIIETQPSKAAVEVKK